MITSERLLVIGLAACSTLPLHAEEPARLPPARMPAWSRSYRLHGGEHPVRLLRGAEGWRIVGWSGWSEGESARDWHESWWVLDVNTEGERRAVFEFPARGNHAQVWDAEVVGREAVVVGGGMAGAMARVNAEGKLLSDLKLNDDGPIQAKALAVTKQGLLVGGSVYRRGESAQDGWLGCFDPNGKKRWSRRFDRGQDETAWDVISLPDGGCVVAINSGKYGKFGEGPSSVWLLRCDAEGNQKHDALLDPGCLRIGHGHLVECFGGVALSYTTTDFPGMRPGSREPGFNTLVALFDGELKQRWQAECPPGMLGSGLLGTDAHGRLVVVSALPRRLMVTRLDTRGKVVATEVTDLDDSLCMMDMAVENDAVFMLAWESAENEAATKAEGTPGAPHASRVVLLKLRS